MWSPTEQAGRAVLWHTRLALESGERRVVEQMPRAAQARLKPDVLKALRTALGPAGQLIADALGGFWVSAEQGSAALRAASQAINALVDSVLADPDSDELPVEWRDDLSDLQGYVSEAVELFG